MSTFLIILLIIYEHVHPSLFRIFLSSQLDATQGFFRELIPHSKHSILDQYYAQVRARDLFTFILRI